ncbi:MAG: alpha/beta hydrolase [Tolypothrix carrinoi HA7290-LM1]|nr:alpha/beta hydrolase [Tolypothrix carrinoi HA7290-LM1]
MGNGKKCVTNYLFPNSHVPNYQCPMPIAPCPITNSQFPNHSL